MPLVLCDASATVKRFVIETGTPTKWAVRFLWREECFP